MGFRVIAKASLFVDGSVSYTSLFALPKWPQRMALPYWALKATHVAAVVVKHALKVVRANAMKEEAF